MAQTKETKGKAETLRITGKNYDAVIRQVADKYHSGNGWSVVRTIDRIITMDVYVERNSEQGVDSQQNVDVVYSAETRNEVSDKLSDTSDKLSDTSDKLSDTSDKLPDTLDKTTTRKPTAKAIKATKEVEK